MVMKSMKQIKKMRRNLIMSKKDKIKKIKAKDTVVGHLYVNKYGTRVVPQRVLSDGVEVFSVFSKNDIKIPLGYPLYETEETLQGPVKIRGMHSRRKKREAKRKRNREIVKLADTTSTKAIAKMFNLEVNQVRYILRKSGIKAKRRK